MVRQSQRRWLGKLGGDHLYFFRMIARLFKASREQSERRFVERSAILDTSKFARIAVDWLLRSDIGEVIKTIVDDEAFPDYALPKKSTGRKSGGNKAAGQMML